MSDLPADDLELETEPLSEDQVRLALRRVKDPEIGLNIVDLGLIYTVALDGADVNVDMSLTSPGCPAGPQILQEAEEQVRSLNGVGAVNINLVWSPPWTPDRIEPRVRAYLGFYQWLAVHSPPATPAAQPSQLPSSPQFQPQPKQPATSNQPPAGTCSWGTILTGADSNPALPTAFTTTKSGSSPSSPGPRTTEGVPESTRSARHPLP
jgi:metal-sulfur cluster biosynthetic enzyme